MGKKRPAIPSELHTLLKSYHFPGNIRELGAMIYDAVARHRSGMLPLASFHETIGEPRDSDSPTASPPAVHANHFSALFGRFPTLKEAEQTLISEALSQANGNQRIAATLLGISRQALNKRLNRETKPSS